MKILLIFFLIVAYKFLINLSHYLRIKKLHKYFSDFVEKKRTDMNLYKQEVISLFKKAHIKDVKTPVSEPIGFGQVVNANVSVFSMFPSLRPVFAMESLNMFEEAEGVFRKNMIDCVNPLYWIELILFLPKSLLSYLGLPSEATAYKLLNVLFYLVAPRGSLHILQAANSAFHNRICEKPLI